MRVLGLLVCVLAAACGGGASDAALAPRPKPPVERARVPVAAPTEPPPAPPAETPTCPPGYAACGTADASACDTDLDRDRAHCGACGTACPARSACVAGACRTGIVGIAGGGSHTCAWDASGQVRCWGLNGVGQLGVRAGGALLAPTALERPTGVAKIAAGRYFNCARLFDGSVECWGAGPLGRGPAAPTHAQAAQVAGVTDAVDISTGRSHACALRRDGHVVCWGTNVVGQLGRGTTATDHLARPVLAIDDAVLVAAGGAHACAVTRGRGVHCWGLNRFGQLGNGETTPAPKPLAAPHSKTPSPQAPEDDVGTVPVPLPGDVVGLADVKQVSLGAFHSCAVTRVGALFCWGHDDAGQLGVGDRVDRPRPTRIALDGVAEVAAGERHTCARLRDGTVHCWGEGDGGRLGDGTGEDRTQPAHVAGVAHAIALAVGDMHGCAVDAGGRIWCWGVNDGQLGDGTTETRLAPVEIGHAERDAAPPNAN